MRLRQIRNDGLPCATFRKASESVRLAQECLRWTHGLREDLGSYVVNTSLLGQRLAANFPCRIAHDVLIRGWDGHVPALAHIASTLLDSSTPRTCGAPAILGVHAQVGAMFVGRSMREQAEARPQLDKSTCVKLGSRREVDIQLFYSKIKETYVY